jgi:protein-S-isoprenylcysteine O-methyltransferase Ste14
MNTAISSANRPKMLLPPRGFLLALLAQVPVIVSNWPLQPNSLEMVAGAALIAWGVLLNIWAERLFRWGATGVCPFSPATVLVRRGPFKLSRNPMYLGLIAISVGVTLATGVFSNIWISVALAIWLHYAYVLPEEEFMHERFGADYEQYTERVPRWMLFK